MLKSAKKSLLRKHSLKATDCFWMIYLPDTSLVFTIFQCVILAVMSMSQYTEITA